MHKVLIPLDFSTASMNAAEFAISMFSARPTHFILLSVITYRQPIGGLGALRSKIEEGPKQDLARAHDILIRKYADSEHIFEKQLVYEEAVDGIIDAAREHDVDSIFMGTTGASGLQEAMMGSVAAGVIKQSKRPVLAIPKGATYSPLKKVVLSTDFKPIESFEAYRYLLGILKESNAEMTVLHIGRDSDAPAMEKSPVGMEFEAFIADTDHRYDYIQDQDPVHAIISYVERHEADLLVMLHHDNPLIGGLFKRSSVEKISMHSQVPLLSLAESTQQISS